jgi:sulfide:quinone oxidoreductase
VGDDERAVSDGSPAEKPRVLIAGGGVTGLEALLALSDLAGDRIDLTLLAPEPDFVYKPLLVEEPFALGPAEHHELAPAAEQQGARFVQRALSAVRVEDHVAELDDGSELGYDMLLVCVGARFAPPFDGAITFPGPEPLRIDEVIENVAEGDGRMAFIVPPGVSWPLPIYELALMTQRRALEQGKDIRIVIVTPEDAPLILFGTVASDQVASLLEGRRIAVETDAQVRELDDGTLFLLPGDRRLEATAAVALPRVDGPRIEGLPADEGGFLPINLHARVRGAQHVYAAGDGTNFPIKQGGLGTQQADAAAQEIAARAGADIDPEPFHPILRGKLLTGEESLHMRHDIAGGGGEGTASADYLWWPPHKIGGRYLSAWLAHEEVHDPEPPRRSLEVEVALPTEWHEDPMALDPYSAPRVD